MFYMHSDIFRDETLRASQQCVMCGPIIIIVIYLFIYLFITPEGST